MAMRLYRTLSEETAKEGRVEELACQIGNEFDLASCPAS